ncbi:capsular biosynthesis protein [Lentibacter algarum]|uniref:capsular polysaccharide export protein, LipB/KpsS family n=1 Tax=Lentibacter algarum TaxID=576131 RepID=UPI001C078121|nr:capsular biosynthesis protein [Lentibacter algarum]MBU2982043.1 capsular biosynthesis protein [Lentibacter algarum]
MKKLRTIAYLAEPHTEKTAFFRAVGEAVGVSKRLPTWPLSLRGFAQTQVRAEAALARAKKQPKSALGRWLKLAFLKARYNWARRYFEAHPEEIALCWQGLTGTRRAFMEGARDAGAQRLFAELAPLPGRLTLDSEGVNAESSVPREVAFYGAVEADQALLAALKDQFEARAPRRADVGQGKGSFSSKDRFLFVPLQVHDDSQLVLFAGWCGGLEGFLAALAEASKSLPEGWHLRLKEHPSAKRAFTEDIKAHIAAGARLVLDNDTDSFAQVAASQGVVTVNSSMGLQAMFFDKPVVLTGQAFWALNGVANKAANQVELTKACADAAGLSFDSELRARFLTWLAREYYIGFEGTTLAEPKQVMRLIKTVERNIDAQQSL